MWTAREDRELRRWLESLARSSNPPSAKMGRWYLQRLEATEPESVWAVVGVDDEPGAAVITYEHPELAKLRALVNAGRARPDRFAHEADKLETYGKLTAAINRAKDNGDLDTLRQIASDPHGFILRQGWAVLDFRDEEQVTRFRKLWESLEMEILNVLEATNQLRESPEFELYELTAKNAKMFDEVVSKQTKLLEKEIIDLTNEADRLSKEIGELTTQSQPGAEIIT